MPSEPEAPEDPFRLLGRHAPEAWREALALPRLRQLPRSPAGPPHAVLTRPLPVLAFSPALAGAQARLAHRAAPCRRASAYALSLLNF